VSAARLRTRRLRLAPLAARDLQAFHALCILPGVRRYLFDGEVLTPARTSDMLGESLRLWEEEGTGLWAVRIQGDDALAGFCGFWYFRTPPTRELVFAVADDQSGLGIATEMSAAMLAHGFTALGFPEIVASTDSANSASIRVMEKLGMKFLRRENVDGLDTTFYLVTATQWPELPRADDGSTGPRMVR
jgi:[ribosomal protein S5]-alanine N-acetyltransferase